MSRSSSVSFGAQVGDVAHRGAGQLDGLAVSGRDVEQGVDVALGEQSSAGGRDVLGVEHHPQQAAGRVHAVGDAMPRTRREQHGVSAGDDQEALVRQLPARLARAHEQRAPRPGAPPRCRPWRRRSGTGSSQRARSRAPGSRRPGTSVAGPGAASRSWVRPPRGRAARTPGRPGQEPGAARRGRSAGAAG